MSKRTDVIAALDLGTTKTTMLVAEVSDDGMSVIGVGTSPAEGLRKGIVISIGKTVESIRKAKHDAEQMSGCLISEVIVGVGGSHVTGVNSQGMMMVRGGEIHPIDVQRALEAATAYSMPPDHQLVNVVPKQYMVDEHDGIKDPVGMSGVRLDCEAHLVTASRGVIDNIRKCAERSGLKIVEVVANPLASSLAVLEENEQELGVATLDIGGGCSGMTVWLNGGLLHTAVLAAGGNLITQDIATGLRTPVACAEELKIRYGTAWGKLVDAHETIVVPGVGGRPDKSLPRRVLSEIIEPRIIELVELARRELEKTGYDELLAGGIVLTGGASQMSGIAELCDELLNLPVRVGNPRQVRGMTSLLENPALCVAYGLALWAAMERCSDMPGPMLPWAPGRAPKSRLKAWWKKMKDFF